LQPLRPPQADVAAELCKLALLLPRGRRGAAFATNTFLETLGDERRVVAQAVPGSTLGDGTPTRASWRCRQDRNDATEKSDKKVVPAHGDLVCGGSRREGVKQKESERAWVHETTKGRTASGGVWNQASNSDVKERRVGVEQQQQQQQQQTCEGDTGAQGRAGGGCQVSCTAPWRRGQ